MNERYAIIDEASGKIINVVMWDGDLQKWQPPNATRAELLSSLDPSTLIFAEPDEEHITAEEAVSRHFSAYQIAALQRFELGLMQAEKPLGEKMSAVKTWLELLLLSWSQDPTAKPESHFGKPPYSFEETSAEAAAALTSDQ